MKYCPMKHLHFDRPQLPSTDFDLAQDHIKISVQVTDMEDDAIMEAVIQAARDAQLTDLYLIDREFVLRALRKELERESKNEGCEYCRGEKALYQHTHTTNLYIDTFGKARTIVVECNPCPPYANCCHKGTPDRSAYIIKFCPECGRKLEVEG